MENKLTYKIKNILAENDYTDIIIKNKSNNESLKITDSAIEFIYKPKIDEAHLSFKDLTTKKIYQIEENSIDEVIINDKSLSIETQDMTYCCYIDTDKIYYL